MTNFSKLLQEIRAAKGTVAIIGLGISGIETALFLQRCGITAVGIEKTPRAQYESKSKFKTRLEELEKAGACLHFGVDGERIVPLLSGCKLAVVSPGVSHESAVYGALVRQGLPILSELELGIELYGRPTAIVTGSNGKSTTVCLLHHILEVAGKDSVLCGNVGVPVVASLGPKELEQGASSRDATLVVEASSYQLESCTVMKPKVGVFLNLSENHLERHGSMQRYFEAKSRLFARQDSEDFAILNADDSLTKSLAGRLRSTLVWFGRSASVANAPYGALIEYEPGRNRDVITLTIGQGSESYDVHETRLFGVHTRYDMAAAALAARLLGAKPDVVQKGLISFVPLEHRAEFVTNSRGLSIINDSKSTTVASALAAFQTVREAMPTKKITLMLGGMAKAGSWEPLLQSLQSSQSYLKPIICFGGDGRLLQSHVQNKGLPEKLAPRLRDAVQQALEQTSTDDVILLSPGCASFDEFSDFEARGAEFKRLIAEFSNTHVAA